MVVSCTLYDSLWHKYNFYILSYNTRGLGQNGACPRPRGDLTK